MHVNVLASFPGCFETWRNGLVLLFAYAQNPPQFVEYWISCTSSIIYGTCCLRQAAVLRGMLLSSQSNGHLTILNCTDSCSHFIIPPQFSLIS